MHWYGGTMAEAVTLSKQRNAIFVVFVEDDNNLSKELASTLDDGAVVKRLTDQNNFLAVKLKSGSENYTFFAQIYQFVPVPSLFFIGRNGTPLEVVCAGVEPQNLATRIDRILLEHRKEEAPDSVQPSTSSRNIREETVNLLQSEATAAQNEAKQTDVQPMDSMSEAPKPASEDQKSAPVAPKAAPEAPKTAPEAPKAATETSKAAPEAPKTDSESPKTTPEAPKSTEVEDSESGPAAKIQKLDNSDAEREVVCVGDVCVRKPKQGMAEGASSSNKQESNPLHSSTVSSDEKVEKAKELIEARRREKADKEKELEKQKELERRSVGQGVSELKRWQADQEMKQIQEERKREKMQNDLARQRVLEQIAQDRAERRSREARETHVTQNVQTPTPATSGDSGSARIQFKMPDGSTHITSFPARATVHDVTEYVTSQLQPENSFSLWTAFPRRELSSPTSTLLELQLAPSAALLVVPRRAALQPVAEPGALEFLMSLFTGFILNPTYQMFSWLRGLLFPGRSAAGPGSREPRPRSTPEPARPDPSRPRSGQRRRGNVHRLNGDGNNDDDNNTWNGNSTQQM